MRKEISAKFTSRCSACGSNINPGETITYDPAVKYSSRHKLCPSTIVHSDVPLNSPGRGALQGRGRSDFFVGDRGDIVRCYVEHGKPAATVPQETIHDFGTKREPQDRYITCIGMGGHWVSQNEADDFDLIGTDGSFSSHWSVTHHYRLATESETATVKAREAEQQRKREEEERAAQEQAAQIVAKVGEACTKIRELLPLGIRPLTTEEYDGAWAAIMTARGHKWGKDHQGREVTPATLTLSTPEVPSVKKTFGEYGPGSYDWSESTLGKAVIASLGAMWNRLPAMPGNEQGTLGWTAIYRWRDRYVVLFVSTGYDSGGPMLQGISIAPEDAGLLADYVNRAAIQGYQFDANLYEIMVALDAEGKLSKYGKRSYFGGTPLPTHGPATKGAYSRHRNSTAAEIRAELSERLNSLDDDRARAACMILADESSVQEIR